MVRFHAVAHILRDFQFPMQMGVRLPRTHVGRQLVVVYVAVLAKLTHDLENVEEFALVEVVGGFDVPPGRDNNVGSPNEVEVEEERIGRVKGEPGDVRLG